MTEHDCDLWLNHFHITGKKTRDALREAYGTTAREIRENLDRRVPLSRLTAAGLLSEKTAEQLKSQGEDWLEDLKRKLAENNMSAVTISDPDYPENLKEIYDPPLALYCKGDPSLLRYPLAVGIVGSRFPDAYGEEVTNFFAENLAAKGICIVSGMAAGVDGIAHRASQNAGGRTIAVLGSGADVCYPARHFNLYTELCRDQLVISEYEPGTPPYASHFPERNRIIAGLCQGVLVTEAKMHSGSLITTAAALEAGREVFAVPGRTGDILSEGTNRLIRDCGAKLVLDPSDILADLSFLPEGECLTLQEKPGEGNREKRGEGKKHEKKAGMPHDQEKVFRILGTDPVFVDDVIRKSGLGISDTIRALEELEAAGRIRQTVRGYYMIRF